jgi:hypothetical protein
MKKFAALIAVLALSVGVTACGDDTKKSGSTTTTTMAKNSSKTTTTAADKKSTDTTTASDQPPESTPEAPTFASAIADMNTALDKSNGDLCVAIAALSVIGSTQDPTSPEDAKAGFESVKRVFDALADAAAAAHPAEAATIKTTTQKMLSDAEAAGWPVEQFSATSAGPAAFQSAEFRTAMTTIQPEFTKCQ